MFHKPAQIKPFAAIKGSERKQILSKLESQSSANFEEEKNSIVPKSIQSAKCILRTGKKAQIYASEGIPLFVGIGDLLIPSVYTLSKSNLSLVPTVYTVPNTLKFLVSGADFMIPGIFGDLPNVPKGTVVQIRSIDTNTLFAVGIALVDLNRVQETDKGKAVEIVNVRGDTLVPESMMPEDIPAGSQDVPPQLQADEPQVMAKQEEKATKDVPLTTEEADDAFMYAAPRALSTRQEYPMPSATFAKLLGENFPYEHPDMLVKSTSWKKLPKFLKHLEKQGMLTIKERAGDTIIESISSDLEKLALSSSEPSAPKSKLQKKEKIECLSRYKLKSSAASIAATNPYYSGAEIKGILSGYVQEHNLKDKAIITIDDNLRKACGFKQDVETAPISKVVEEFVRHSAQAYHQINRNGQPEGKLTKGPVPSITLNTERKGGNKVVTKVMGMEAFGFGAKALAEHLRIACAGSATVSEVTASKNSKPQPIVQIQGDHIAKIAQYLEQEGVKSSWIKR